MGKGSPLRGKLGCQEEKKYFRTVTKERDEGEDKRMDRAAGFSDRLTSDKTLESQSAGRNKTSSGSQHLGT